MTDTTTRAAKYLILVRSDMGDGGWSLHAPGSSDEDIAEGVARALASGTAAMDADGEWDAPTEADYVEAIRAYRYTRAVTGADGLPILGLDVD